MNAALLDVRDLDVRFPGDGSPVRAVNGVSFTVAAGERVGIAGESGAGKTMTGLTIMGLVRRPALVSGQVLFHGRDLLRLKPREWRRLRGARLAMILQNPLASLNPVMTVGGQIAEAIRAHRDVRRAAARAQAVELLGRVGIPAPARNADEYPHRFSGGMRQRVMIAIALAGEPELLIADEPTTALDVTIQAQIIDLLAAVCEERGTAVVLITHNLGLLAGFAERIVVMYAGKVMEEAPVDTIYYGATHPYTWGLMTSVTRIDAPRRLRLAPIEGNPPVTLPSGCVFHPRCPYAQRVCIDEVPPLRVHSEGDHPSACHFAGRLEPPGVLREAP